MPDSWRCRVKWETNSKCMCQESPRAPLRAHCMKVSVAARRFPVAYRSNLNTGVSEQISQPGPAAARTPHGSVP